MLGINDLGVKLPCTAAVWSDKTEVLFRRDIETGGPQLIIITISYSMLNAIIYSSVHCNVTS